MIKIKNVTSDILFIAPGDTLLLTFGRDYDLDEMETVAKRVAEEFPDNKIIINMEGLITDIKIMKEEPPFPAIQLNGGDYNSTGRPYFQDIGITTSNVDTKEFKLNDYIY